MRLNIKWLVAIGLLLGVAEFWWEHHSAQEEASIETDVAPGVVTAFARENAGPPGVATASATVTNWQTKVGEALSPGVSTTDQAKNLLTLFPTLPPAGQFETAHHISNLLPDDAYAAWAGYLTNTAASAEAQRVIYADLLHRPNSIKLPLLLALARNPSTANSAGAAQLLRATFREDFGSDWNAWQSRIQAWLKENPDNGRPGFSGMTVGN
jgi:hypothetical protein